MRRTLGYVNYAFYIDTPATGRAAISTFLKDCIDKGVRPGEKSLTIIARKSKATEADICEVCSQLATSIGENMVNIPEHNRRLREFLEDFRDLCADRALGNPIPEVKSERTVKLAGR